MRQELKPKPRIDQVMTRFPKTIRAETPVRRAETMMHQLGIRHLPVVNDDGKLIGVLSARDLEFISLFPNHTTLRADAVMTAQPYFVQRGVPLHRVVQEMAAHRYGSAIVLDEEGKPEGIFTSIDALRLLSEILGSSDEQTMGPPKAA